MTHRRAARTAGRKTRWAAPPRPWAIPESRFPVATDLARARAILEELRRRSAQMSRPQAERDYLDRLLKAF